MGQANRRGILLYILSAGVGRAEHIQFDVAGININVGFLHAHLWQDLHQGKGSMPAMGRVEWGKAHQAMHPFFRTQIAKGVFSTYCNVTVLMPASSPGVISRISVVKP